MQGTYIKILVNVCKCGICERSQERFPHERWGFTVLSLLCSCIVSFRHTLSVMLLGYVKMWQQVLKQCMEEALSWCIHNFRGLQDAFVIANK
jgi:hypothetical protein